MTYNIVIQVNARIPSMNAPSGSGSCDHMFLVYYSNNLQSRILGTMANKASPPHIRNRSRLFGQAVGAIYTPELLITWYSAILQGHGNPVIVDDERCVGGQRVTWDVDRDPASTPEQKERAIKTILEYSQGLPVQSINMQALYQQVGSDDRVITSG